MNPVNNELTIPVSAEAYRPQIDYGPYHSVGGESIEQSEAAIRAALCEYALGHLDVVAVGESGFAVLGFPSTTVGGEAVVPETYSPGWTPAAEGTEPVLLVDLDDTLVDYSGAKTYRDSRFLDAVAQRTGLGGEAALSTAKTLMRATDNFARWQEGNRQEMYHDLAHELAVGWSLDQLAQGMSVEDIVTGLKLVVSGQGEAPFSFDGRRLLCDRPEQLIDEDVRQIFAPMHNPALFTEVARQFQLMQRRGAHPSILTRGGYGFQAGKGLRQYLHLARPVGSDPFSPVGRGWPFENMLLTTDNKGVFLRDLHELSKTDPRIKEAFFGDQPHAMLLLDDSQGENDGVAGARGIIEAESGAVIGTVPSLRRGTKNSTKWAGVSARHIVRNMIQKGHEEPYIEGGFSMVEPVICRAISSVVRRALAKGRGDAEVVESLQAQESFFSEIASRYSAVQPQAAEQLWIDRHRQGPGRVARYVGRVVQGLREGRI